jgi:hypothetical protein
MNSGDGTESPEKRLALYLQEQYHERVIDPVAEQINPEASATAPAELYAAAGPATAGNQPAPWHRPSSSASA